MGSTSQYVGLGLARSRTINTAVQVRGGRARPPRTGRMPTSVPTSPMAPLARLASRIPVHDQIARLAPAQQLVTRAGDEVEPKVAEYEPVLAALEAAGVLIVGVHPAFMDVLMREVAGV